MIQGWKLKTLGEIAEVQSGGTPLKSRNEYWFGDIPWYSSGELNETFTKRKFPLPKNSNCLTVRLPAIFESPYMGTIDETLM